MTLEQFFLSLVGLLCIGGIQAMSLPLVYPIKGFTKTDEFLLNTRESLRTSSFHVYVGERGPEVLKIRRLFSLCDSTYLYGITPRVFCTTSRLAILDSAALEKALTAKKTAQQTPKSRKARVGKQVKGGKAPVAVNNEEGRMVHLPAKRISFLIEREHLAVLYGTVLATLTLKTADMRGFLGMMIEGHKGNLHRFSLYFVPEMNLEELPDWIHGLTQIRGSEGEYSDVVIQWDPALPASLSVPWELRNHMTGRLIATFTNKDALQFCLEWTRAENLWDIVLVRAGKFEELKRSPVSLVSGNYNKYSFHQEIMEHVNFMELEGKKTMNYDIWGGFFPVQAMYFYRDVNSAPVDFTLSYVIKCPATASEQTPNANLAALVRMETFSLAKELFVNTYLNSEKPMLRANQMPSIEAHRIVKEVPLERFPIIDVTDILEMGNKPWARHGIKMQTNEMLTFELTHEQALPTGNNSHLVKFGWAVFMKENLPLVLIRAFELLLSNPNAWWLPYLKRVTFKPTGETNGAMVEMSVYFFNHPDVVDFKEKEWIAGFILSCVEYAEVGNGLMNTKTNKIITRATDVPDRKLCTAANTLKGAVWETISKATKRLAEIPGPISIFANVADFDENAIILSRQLSPELKSSFEAVSKVGWESRFKRLGNPTFFFDSFFRKTVRLDEYQRTFGVLADWVLRRGPVITHSFVLKRDDVPELLDFMNIFVSGGAGDFLGTAFLGALFEFDAEFTGACKYDPLEQFILTLFLDTEASLEQLGAVAHLLDIVEDEPLELHSRLLMEDVIDEKFKAIMPCAWFLNSTFEEGGPKVFSDFYILEHYMSWIKPELLPFVTLQTTLVHDDILEMVKEPAIVHVDCPTELVMGFLFTKEPFSNLLAEGGLFTLFKKLTFAREESLPLVRISYHVAHEASIDKLRSMLESRLLGIMLKGEYGLDFMSRLDIQVTVGKFTCQAENYSSLQESMKQWPKTLNPTDTLSFFKSTKTVPKKGQVRAYHVTIDTSVLKPFFIKCLQYLSGSQGGFWARGTLGVILQKQKGPEDADWDAIWIVDNDAQSTHMEFLTLYGKLLLLCEYRSPLYSIGKYNFGTGRFEASQKIEELVDDFYGTFSNSFSVHLPKWLLDQRRREAAKRAKATAIEIEQSANDALLLALLKQEELRQISLQGVARHIELEMAESNVQSLKQIRDAKQDTVKEHELELKSTELILNLEEKKVAELKDQESVLEDSIKQLLKKEAEFDEMIRALEQEASEKAKKELVIVVKEEQAVAAKEESSFVTEVIELKAESESTPKFDPSPIEPSSISPVLSVCRKGTLRPSISGRCTRPNNQVISRAYFK